MKSANVRPFKRNSPFFNVLLSMDDKILFYIVLGIIYFLFNRLKKKKPAEDQDADSPQRPLPPSGPKPMTFEDLLREIQEAKQPTSRPPVERQREYEKPKPQPQYVDYDDDLEEEAKSLEKTSFDDERSNQVYDDAKKLAFTRPSLEETMKLGDVKTSFGKFKEFEKQQDSGVLVDIIRDLKDPKGFRKAFLLSEVINRKHF